MPKRIGPGGPFLVDSLQGTDPAPFVPGVDAKTLDARHVRQLGGVLLVPNLLLTTLATVAYLQRPPLFSSPQRPPQVVATQQTNLLETTLAPTQFPVGKQQLASAPLASFRVGLDQQTNLLGTTLATTPSIPIGKQQLANAPLALFRVSSDQQANLLESTLAPTPAPALPTGKQQLASAPAALFQIAPALQSNLLGTTLAPTPAPALLIGGSSQVSTPSLFRVNADTSRGTPTPLIAPAPPALPAGKAALANAPERSRWLPADTSQSIPKTLTLDLLFAPADMTEQFPVPQRPWDVTDTSRSSSIALLTAAPPPPASMPRGATFQLPQRWAGSVVDTSQSSPEVLLAATPPLSPFTPQQYLGPVKYSWQPADTSQSSPVPLLTAVVAPPFTPAQHLAPVRFTYRYADTTQGTPLPLIAPPAPVVPFTPSLIGTLPRLSWQPADTSLSTPKPLYADAVRPFKQSDFPPSVNYRHDHEWHELNQPTNPNLFPPAPPPPPPPPSAEKDFYPGIGGAPAKKLRERKKYLVEIDGEDFYVNSAAEAQELLEQAEQIAKERAQAELDKALKSTLKLPKLKRVIAHKLQLPVVRVPQAEVDSTAAAIEQQTRLFQANIAQLYAEVARAMEIGVLLRRQIDDDDEDAITVLLL